MQWMESVFESCKLDNGIRGKLIVVLAFISSSFFIYTSYFGSFPAIIQRSVLLVLALSLIFLHKPFSKKHIFVSAVVDLLLIIICFTVFIYIWNDRAAIGYRVGNPNILDILMAAGAVLVVIEATRRTVGRTLPILVAIFGVYGYFGPYMPEVLMHRGLDIGSFASCIYMGEEGIFGTPVAVTADFIMIYIIFGAFLRISGAGEFFIKMAEGAFGWMRGGPAKAAVISSALMGTVSGSAVANVVTTGTFTIPLMKKTGYRNDIAGAVESVASTGGQIMPPIMGAAAFIMADFLQVPYWKIVVSAAIPALLYYFSLFFMVDLEAARTGLKGRPKNELPDVKKTLIESGYLVIPLFLLIYLMGVIQYSPQKAAFFTIVCILLVSSIKAHTRLNFTKFLTAMVEGALGGLEVAAVCACAGIVIGILMRTGLGMALTGVLIELSGGKLPILMILTMIASIIMGMGLPTSACYIIVAVLISPAMIRMGVEPIAAHLFSFYYACMSTITPPVALASYAAASLAKSDPMRTGFQAVRLGACGFIVPFMFVYGPQLLFIGQTAKILQAFITSIIGTYSLAIGLIGYQKNKVSIMLRPLYLVSAFMLILPGTKTDIIGISLIISLSILNYFKKSGKFPVTV